MLEFCSDLLTQKYQQTNEKDYFFITRIISIDGIC